MPAWHADLRLAFIRLTHLRGLPIVRADQRLDDMWTRTTGRMTTYYSRVADDSCDPLS